MWIICGWKYTNLIMCFIMVYQSWSGKTDDDEGVL